MFFYSARIWILNVALWLMSSIHECKASLLNYHIIAMNICRLICPRVADLTSSETTLILNVVKWCFQAHFRCTIQAQDCQLLKEMGYLLAQEEHTGSSNSEKIAAIMGEGPHSHMKCFGVFPFWQVNAQPSVNIISVSNGHSHNWFWESNLQKPRD